MLASFDLVDEGGVALVGVTSNAGLLVDGTLLLVETGVTLDCCCRCGTGDGSSK